MLDVKNISETFVKKCLLFAMNSRVIIENCLRIIQKVFFHNTGPIVKKMAYQLLK